MTTDRNDYSQNLRLYSWIKLLTKRIHLPFIVIYLAEVDHLSVTQIGLLVIISAATSILSGIPTGYLADRFTHKAALMSGAALLSLGSACYVVLPNFTGASIATIIEALGFSYISGAGEALMHNTLVVIGKANEYVRVMGRAQSFGLIGNVILLSLITLTYSLDKRLPFICGTVATLVFVALASRLREPPSIHAVTNHSNSTILHVIRRFMHRRSVWFFISLGLLSGVYGAYAPMNNLVLKDLGLSSSLFGFVFAGSSIVGALGGRFIHLSRHLSLLQYAWLDACICAGSMLIIGLTHNLGIAATTLVLNLGFWRLRSIIYQNHLLKLFPGAYKATLISAMSFFENGMELWLPIVFASTISLTGFYVGSVVLGTATLIIVGGLMTYATRQLILGSAAS
jgi:MFS family permease